jgi:hypothetical protein
VKKVTTWVSMSLAPLQTRPRACCLWGY